MKFMKSETFTNSKTFFLQIHKRLQIQKLSELFFVASLSLAEIWP